jgi:hypothetical protein
MLMHHIRECASPYLFNETSNPLQPAQAEGVLGHHSVYIASLDATVLSQQYYSRYILDYCMYSTM